MGWRVWGSGWDSADEIEGTSLYQPVVFNRDVVLRAARTWIIVVGDPVFDSLSMKIYSNRPVDSFDAPGKLLHSSTDTRAKAEIHTLANGVKEIFFTFADIPLKGTEVYNFVINGAGYVPAPNSHLAWMKGFPDPVYATGYTPAIETINRAPFQIYFIGGTL